MNRSLIGLARTSARARTMRSRPRSPARPEIGARVMVHRPSPPTLDAGANERIAQCRPRRRGRRFGPPPTRRARGGLRAEPNTGGNYRELQLRRHMHFSLLNCSRSSLSAPAATVAPAPSPAPEGWRNGFDGTGRTADSFRAAMGTNIERTRKPGKNLFVFLRGGTLGDRLTENPKRRVPGAVRGGRQREIVAELGVRSRFIGDEKVDVRLASPSPDAPMEGRDHNAIGAPYPTGNWPGRGAKNFFRSYCNVC